MTSDRPTDPVRIRDRLAGEHLLVTGATGFLAKAFVEKLLRSVNSVGSIHLLVRPRPGKLSPEQRVARDVLGPSAFDRLRALLGDRFEQLCQEKIHVVPGDLTKERMGLDARTYEELTQRVTLVVNSAATVTFDEQLDLALALNGVGPTRLLRFAQRCGSAPFLHVSTCYVCGDRRGIVGEDVSAPELAQRALPRIPDTGEFDLDALIDSMSSEAEQIRTRLGAGTEACRRGLIDAGMQRARAYGWNDTYTFTKWIGEQLLIRDHGDVPLVIFRPAIIEGSYNDPLPGWIDGLRMADPLIVAYGRGKLKEFPGRPDLPLDLIPVDFVANAMIATLPTGPGSGSLAIYHSASSDRNPLRLATLASALRRAFNLRPMNDNGRPVFPLALSFADYDKFVARWGKKQRRVAQLRRLLEPVHAARRQVRKLAGVSRQIEQLLYFTKIYAPYTHLDCRFSDGALRTAAETLHPDDRAEFQFDVERIDWEEYIVNRHIPGLRSYVLGTGAEPSRRIAAVEELGGAGPAVEAEVLQRATIFEAFQRSVERFTNKPVFQIRRSNRWVRYTYNEALCATGTIMQRFVERGLSPGDRVAICAENGPEWGLTYLAAMRAGLTAVPLDPQLPPAEAWASARFAQAGLMCAGAATFDGLSRERAESDVDLVSMVGSLVPPPAASRDATPDPVSTPHTAVASILFTSGTTVAPKGVQLTHRNFLSNATALLQVHPVYPGDEFLSVLPMYHAFEFTGGFLVPILCGATITYVEKLKGPEIRSAMQATGTTVLLAVPRLLRLFYDGITDRVAKAGPFKRAMFRLFSTASHVTGGRGARMLFRAVHSGFGGRLRMIVSGGSRLDPDLLMAFKRMGFTICEGYGLTETAPVLTVNPPDDVRCGSVGRALPNVELAIRNENLDGVGEVWVHGPNVMSGYLDNRGATKDILIDGWLRTGDLGKLDADGYLYLTGRSTDLIVTGAGKNVHPDEVEQRYGDLPYVREMCVFGMPLQGGLGDAVHAVVVVDRDEAPQLDQSSIEREIRLAAEAISDSIPPHQRIAVLHFWDRELPKTSTLKAKRGVVREIVRADTAPSADSRAVSAAPGQQRGADALPSEGSVGDMAVREILAGKAGKPVDAIRPDMHLLLDLGIDSIGKIDLIGEIEARFRMQIPEEWAANVARVVDLLRIVGERQPSAGGVRDRSVWQRRLRSSASAVTANGRLARPLLPIRWLVRGGVTVLMNTYVRVRVSGRDNIVKKGAFILAPNHSSHLDSPSVVTAVGGKRRVWIVGAEDYFFSTRLRRFVFGQLLDTIAFDRQADGVLGLRRCSEVLSRGDGVLIFPEGTRSLTGEIQPFKVGVAVLAIECNVPIIPVCIHHTFELLRKGQRFIRPGTVSVAFGKPIYPPADDEIGDRHEAFRRLAGRVERAVVSLRDEASV